MILNLTEEQREWLSRMQADWRAVMCNPDWEKTFLPIPRLESHHMRDAKLVPSREVLLELLPKGGVVGELGTDFGHFAKGIHDVIRPVELHLFDLTFEKFNRAGLLPADAVRKHLGDSATNLSAFPDGYFDWLYIDGDHSYEGVKRDIEQAVRKIKPSGFLVFNDFTYWCPLTATPFGVAEAVCELCLSRDWEIFYFTLHPWMYCDVAVRPCPAAQVETPLARIARERDAARREIELMVSSKSWRLTAPLRNARRWLTRLADSTP